MRAIDTCLFCKEAQEEKGVIYEKSEGYSRKEILSDIAVNCKKKVDF